jgi:hypothetical protein
MTTKITFTSNDSTAQILTPQWGYQAVISMSMSAFRGGAGEISWWDNGSTYDTRRCKASFKLNATDAGAIDTFLTDPARGRGADITLSLGSTGSGFFPFGPDKGDRGNFVIRETAYSAGGQLHSPWLWWSADLEMAMVSSPTYNLPSQSDDGNLQVGNVTGLRYPQAGYEPSAQYAVTNIITRGGQGYSVDRGQSGDVYETGFKLSGSQAKISAVVNHLVNTVRGDNFNIVTQAKNFPLGRAKQESGTFQVKLASPDLVVTHTGFDKFELDLQLIFEAQS